MVGDDGLGAVKFAHATVQQQRLIYAAITIVVVLLWVLDARSPPTFPVDDAYITAHNARVITSGHDANYGVSGFVGATSILHLLLTSLFALALPVARALHTVMWLGALAYVLGLARLAFAFRASVVQAALLVVAGSVVAEVPHQLMNGLETGLALAGITWTLALASEGLRQGRYTAALCGALPLVRPELIALSGLVFLVQAHARWRAGPSRGVALRAIAIDAAIAGAVVLPFVITLWAATGSLVPGTINAKRDFFAEGCLPSAIRKRWVLANIWEMAGMLGAMCIGVAFLALTSIGRAGLGFAIVLLIAYYREFPGSLAHAEHRYMYPLVPIIIYGVASCLREDRRLLRWIANGAMAVTVVFGGLLAPATWARHERSLAFTRDELAAVAGWARDHIPPGSNVLIHDAGYIAYATDLPLTDFVGLKTPSSAIAHERWTWPTCGRERGNALDRIAFDSGAHYMIILNVWNRLFGFVHALRAHGWSVRLVRPTTDVGYEVYEISPPAPRF